MVDNEGCIDYAAFVDSFSMNASTLTWEREKEREKEREREKGEHDTIAV